MEENIKAIFLGFPLSVIGSRGDFQKKIGQIFDRFIIQLKPQFLTTVDASKLSSLTGWRFWKMAPGTLLDQYRLHTLLLPHGQFLHFWAKTLGGNLGVAFTGSDLLQILLDRAVKLKETIFVLGDNEATCKKMVHVLREDFPDLKIGGVLHPHIFTAGEKLDLSCEQDSYLLDSIHHSKTSLLLLLMAQDKETLWFQRIKENLKVPLTVGCGSFFNEYIASREGKIHANPPSLSALLKFIVFTPFIILYQSLTKAISYFYHKKNWEGTPKLFLSSHESLLVIPLPPNLHVELFKQNSHFLEEMFEQDRIILDLKDVIHADLEGIGFLYALYQRAKLLNKSLLFIHVSHDFRSLLKLAGVLDLFAPYICQNSEEALRKISPGEADVWIEEQDFISVDQSQHKLKLSIFGRLNCFEDLSQLMQRLSIHTAQRNCEIDCTHCTQISSRGFAFLLKLKEHQKSQRGHLSLHGVSRPLYQQFVDYKLSKAFTFSN